MANDVKITIKLNPDAEVSRFGDVYVDNPNKVANTSYSVNSSGKYNALPKSTQQDVEGLSWARGYLVFNSSGYLANADTLSGALTSEQNPQELVWGATDSNGYYEVTITFKNASNMENLIVYGDEVSNQFPTMAYVDNSSEPIYNSELKWTIPITKANEHSVRFVQWNRANYNAIVDRISMRGDYLFVDKFNGLKSVESLSQSTGQPKDIYYGIVPSDGSVEILDIDGEIEEMVRYEVIPVSNMPLDIVIGENQVQSHISQDSDYNSQSKLLNLSVSNKLESWLKIASPKSKYPYSSTTNLFGVLMLALFSIGYGDERLEMIDTNIVYGFGDNLHYGTIREYLERIKFNFGYAYTNATTIYDLINEICTIAQLNLFQLDNGRIKFISARPLAHADSKVVRIPLRNQAEILQRDVFLKNKYENVKYIKNTLVESVGTILDNSYNIRDEEGNINLTNIDGDNVQLVTNSNGDTAICFFKTITNSAELIRVDSNIWGRFNQYPFVHGFVFGEDAPSSSEEGSSIGIATSDLTKEQYSFVTNAMASKCVQLTQYSTNTSETFAITIKLDSDALNYAETMSVKIYGSIYNISESETYINDKGNVLDISFNKGLLSDKLNYNYANETISMYDMIANNIVYDYSNGITTATLSVVCNNYYDTNGNLAIDWSKGEILQVGDIVQVDKDNNGTSAVTYANGEPMRFKITGRTFRKVGVPMIDLELQEVKLVQV